MLTNNRLTISTEGTNTWKSIETVINVDNKI